MNFSALTFNLQNGEPWVGQEPESPPSDFEGAMEFLKSQDADVIFLQEVEEGKDGGAQTVPPVNYSRLRSSFSEYFSTFAYPPVNPDELPFGLGLAILSRWQLEDVRVVELPAADVEFEFGGRSRKPSRRSLISAVAVTPVGRLRVLNTHLQAYFMIGTSSVRQPGQREALEKCLLESDGATLLGGDFNCTPEEGLVERMEAIGYRTTQNELPTWKRKPLIVDHLFFNSGLRLLRSEVVRTNCSDHDAVRAEFCFSQ